MKYLAALTAMLFVLGIAAILTGLIQGVFCQQQKRFADKLVSLGAKLMICGLFASCLFIAFFGGVAHMTIDDRIRFVLEFTIVSLVVFLLLKALSGRLE